MPTLPLKRKISDVSSGEVKRGQAKDFENGDLESSEESEYIQPIFDHAVEDAGGYVTGLKAASSNKWLDTITEVVKSVVSIQFTHVSNFDTEVAVVSEATGFVVDAKRGLILTNRHVVGPGPFCGYIVFDNHEEAVVKPIYRDPVHDFGFLKFDPNLVKYMKLSEIKLRPELAQVGTEIRVVGNDAGEKLSILSGFISRIDRNAPDYGVLTYNDFNTEYIQAAAAASGGSSGSPVVDENGYAVALQAGGSTEASTDFFLPVYRPLRALECIQKQLPVTRGDIQVEWMLKPYDECIRLGLDSEAEAKARQLFPDKVGLLVAEMILPEGPASGLIKEGDILLEINGEPIVTFIKYDDILDENVGNELEFKIQRGGEYLSQRITIDDLHKITPDRYVDICGALFNELSYQIARSYCVPIKGVYVNDASGSFEFSSYDKNCWIIETLDDKHIHDLDTFIEVMKSIPDRKRVSISYRHLSDLNTENIHVIYVERHWQSTFRLAVRNDETGLWDFTDIQDKPLEPETLLPRKAKYVDIPGQNGYSSLIRSFVQVRTIAPIPLDSHPFTRDVGYGIVVDAKKGYVLVSRKFVPHDMCDIFIVFAESVDVPAKIMFLHPNQNYAIVKYDPSLVLADVTTPKFSNAPLKRGEKCNFVGYNYNFRLVTDEVKVSSISSLNIPSAMSPRYRGTNLDCIVLDNKVSQECDSGVLVDGDGTLRAFWLIYLGETNCDQTGERLYRMGFDVTSVLEVIEGLKNDKVPNKLRILDAEFTSITVLQARTRGVSQEWIDKLERECDDELNFLATQRLFAPTLNVVHNPLKTGDIILSVNEKLVKSMKDFNIMYTSDFLKFRVVRHKKEVDLDVPTLDASSFNTSHVLFWCGAILQAPHQAVRQYKDTIPSEVYVTRKSSGGPAHQYGITTNSFITEVNDEETKTLDSFIKVVKDIPDNTYLKLRLVSFDGVPVAISLKTNYHYFPTSELKKTSQTGEWEEIEHKASS